MSDDDVKFLLARALGQEPPLGIDRDEVVREGRKRLRRRRLFGSVGVVAAVVVVAAGAATLPNLVTGSAPERMPPAATSILSTTPSVPVTSDPPAPPTSRVEPPLSESWAAELTATLHRSGHLPDSAVSAADDGPPKFQVLGDKYVYQAHINTQNGQGTLQVTVEDARGYRPDCVVVIGKSPYSECEVRTKNDVDLLVARRWSDEEGPSTYVLTVLPDGSLVSASVSQEVAGNGTSHGTPPDGVSVLDDETLCAIVAKSGLRVR